LGQPDALCEICAKLLCSWMSFLASFAPPSAPAQFDTTVGPGRYFLLEMSMGQARSKAARGPGHRLAARTFANFRNNKQHYETRAIQIFIKVSQNFREMHYHFSVPASRQLIQASQGALRTQLRTTSVTVGCYCRTAGQAEDGCGSGHKLAWKLRAGSGQKF